MTSPNDWIAMEQRVSGLLLWTREDQNRQVLLAEISAYAHTVVQAAREAPPLVPTAQETAAARAWLGRPVFVCGHHRSGTTLLQQLLDGHPELLVLPSEGTYLDSFGYVARANPSTRNIDRFAADWIERFVDPNYAPHFKLGTSTIRANPSLCFVRRLFGWHDTIRSWNPGQAQMAMLLALAAAYHDVIPIPSSPSLWVEKTPLNENHVLRLSKLTDARFIQLVRDPGATLTSLRAAIGRGRFDATRHAAAIARSITLACENERKYSSRYLVVRYEDLTGNIAGEMERVRAFLGIGRTPSLIVPTVGGRPVCSNSSFDRADPGVVRRSRGAPPLSRTDAALIGAFAATGARHFDYRVAHVPLMQSIAIHLRQLYGKSIFRVRSFTARTVKAFGRI